MTINANAERYIELSRGGYQVRLGNFLRPLPHLIAPIQTQIGRNSDNTPIGYGPIQKGPYEIEFTAQLTTDEYNQLEGVRLDFENARETYQDFGIQADCTFQQVREYNPRTRPLVPTTAETAIGGSIVSYFPRFKMAITNYEVVQYWPTPQYEVVLRVRLQELDKYPI